jgi:hypothetical protein
MLGFKSFKTAEKTIAGIVSFDTKARLTALFR